MKFFFPVMLILLLLSQNLFIMTIFFILTLLSFIAFSVETIKSGWFLYFLMMIYLGGLLILFLYVSSLLKKEIKGSKQALPLIVALFIFIYLLGEKSAEGECGLFFLLERWEFFSLVALILIFVLLFSGTTLSKVGSPTRSV